MLCNAAMLRSISLEPALAPAEAWSWKVWNACGQPQSQTITFLTCMAFWRGILPARCILVSGRPAMCVQLPVCILIARQLLNQILGPELFFFYKENPAKLNIRMMPLHAQHETGLIRTSVRMQ